MRLHRTFALLLGLGCGASAPSRAPDATPADAGPALTHARTQPDAGTPDAPAEEPAAPTAGESVRIPAGVLHVGSRPGTLGRRAHVEADLDPVELPAFEIDRLPYPNDPAKPPRTAITHVQAAALCEAEGKRLCSELEWERACKGDEVDRLFPGGDAFPSEGDCDECDTPFGVSRLGTHVAEWTASPATRGLVSASPTVIFRGARRDAEPTRHRCAARHSAPPSRETSAIGFRCCRGAATTLAYPDEPSLGRFRPMTLENEELRRILSRFEALRPYAADFTLTQLDDARRAVTRGDGTTHGWELIDGVLRWAPISGEEAWVLAGTGGGAGLLVVLHPMPGGRYALGASLVLRDEAVPIAIGFTPPEPTKLLWGAAWGEIGEAGSLDYEDGQVRIHIR